MKIVLLRIQLGIVLESSESRERVVDIPVWNVSNLEKQ